MNRNRMLIGAFVTILVAAAASTFVYRQMQRVTIVKPVEMGNFVVAAMRLPLGTRLEPRHLKMIPWPASEPVTGMYNRAEDCVNRALITSVVENEPILEGKLAPEKAGGGLPATIPEGMRAVSVSVNDVVAVAGYVLPSTMVDVLVTGSVEGRGANSQAVTRTILENIRVLAAGQKLEQDKDGKPQTVPVITLLVTPEEANKLTMASMEGRIQLALRNTIDTAKANAPAAYRASVFGGPPTPRKSAGVQPKTQPFVVEVIRGTKRDTNAFPNP